jgi:hypothetical protein
VTPAAAADPAAAAVLPIALTVDAPPFEGVTPTFAPAPKSE